MKIKDLKFRVWDMDGKRMFTNVYITTGDMGTLPFNGDWGDTIDLDYAENIEITQYTGLKDKNGKEIYEGDIIKFKRKTHEHVVVEFKDDGFKISVKIGSSTTRTTGVKYLISEYQCEVIGNIYENPELIS